MKYCWHENKNRISSIATLILLAGVGGYWIFSAYKSITAWNWPPIVSLLFFGFGLVQGCKLLIVLVVQERRYAVDCRGISIQYPFKIRIEYPWENFSEVAICKVRYSTRVPGMHSVAIRCVVGDEKTGPSHAKFSNERWSSEEYEALSFGRIISIEFSEERFLEIKSVYPGTIKDYRYLAEK